jgi:hypothetical protein
MDGSNDSRKKQGGKGHRYDYKDDFLVGDEDEEMAWEKIKEKKNLNLQKEFQSQAAKAAENNARQRLGIGKLKTLAQRVRGDRA